MEGREGGKANGACAGSPAVGGPSMCATHEGWSLDSFCTVHYEMCCTQCIISKNARHNGCKTIPFDDEENARLVKQNLAADIGVLEEKAESMEDVTAAQLKERQSRFDENVEGLRKEVTNLFQLIREKIDSLEKELLTSLEETYEKKSQSLISIMGDIANRDETSEIINAGKEAMEWEEAEWKGDKEKMREILMRGCNVRAEIKSIDELEKLANEALMDVPTLAFSYKDEILDILENFGKIANLGEGELDESGGESIESEDDDDDDDDEDSDDYGGGDNRDEDDDEDDESDEDDYSDDGRYHGKSYYGRRYEYDGNNDPDEYDGSDYYKNLEDDDDEDDDDDNPYFDSDDYNNDDNDNDNYNNSDSDDYQGDGYYKDDYPYSGYNYDPYDSD